MIICDRCGKESAVHDVTIKIEAKNAGDNTVVLQSPPIEYARDSIKKDYCISCIKDIMAAFKRAIGQSTKSSKP